MRHKHFKLSAILLLGFGLTGLQAQTSINATGGDASSSGGSVSYSVGQLVYSTNIGENGFEVQGVQQPYEISVITAIEEVKDIKLMVSAYPNPSTNYLILELIDFSNSTFSLYDLNGKLLQSEKIKDSQTKIDISNFESSIYFIKVIRDNTEVKVFKVIKK